MRNIKITNFVEYLDKKSTHSLSTLKSRCTKLDF